ncbi:MAG: hypothetical protein H0W96_02270 [Solirubrobacterales bacterium]|nr:hypothetical protein [Solirubrobacterales bacterium]
MLFDLRGRGRRRTVRVIYLSLAILMGGGLVLFGIGSNTSGGGILDAVVGEGASNSATGTIDKRIKAAAAKAQANPKDPDAWAQLASLRYQRAGIDGIGADDITYTAKGKQKLALATDAWERHLDLDPEKPDVRVAKFMVQAYAKTGIEQPAKAVQAMQIVTAAEDPPSSNLYAQLAQLAYTAKDLRTGDLAADKAVELADDKDKKQLRTALEGLKAQALKPDATTTAPS